ncbi:MAG: hypothetical protein PHC90_09850, partial [Syntrophorhabdaceae bacterium]|nr:hypothetical protein [Syntrophorhabdaceae bacterium]
MALCIILSFPLFTYGADLIPNYSDALEIAIRNASSPSGWQPASLYVIPDGGATEGLFYDGTRLVVRTATKSGNFKSNYVGQAGYKIFGGATTHASWVTVGNDAT